MQFLRQAADADARQLSNVMVLLGGLLAGTESEAPPPPAERRSGGVSYGTGKADSRSSDGLWRPFSEQAPPLMGVAMERGFANGSASST